MFSSETWASIKDIEGWQGAARGRSLGCLPAPWVCCLMINPQQASHANSQGTLRSWHDAQMQVPEEAVADVWEAERSEHEMGTDESCIFAGCPVNRGKAELIMDNRVLLLEPSASGCRSCRCPLAARSVLSLPFRRSPAFFILFLSLSCLLME